ncbi:MAG: archaeal proteasome endopeptidase complex subunit beta [Nitrososphaerota archaeon]
MIGVEGMFGHKADRDIVLKTGTTTVGLVVKDAVVFATDTRVTSGYFIAHRKGKKVFPLADHAAITIAGRVADAQNIIDVLRANINYYQIQWARRMDIMSVARLASNFLFNYRYFPLIAQLIIGGVDGQGPHLYNIDPTGSMTEELLIATGSGSPVAYGVIELGYRPDLGLEEGIRLAFKSVASAIRRDIGTGDSIDVAYITTTKPYTELTLEEKAPLYDEFLKIGIK